ncbi:hypothetical protein KCP76_26455 (plasmid) [Salmonella enterica subsp. enterica serovar Weltevreden]|nr:hypothetical protein KCP76_26455 [Salmonella enterica subsp. enterica serovar Weltevreden]
MFINGTKQQNEAALTKSINQRFLEQAEKTRQHCPSLYESFLSYHQELNHKANQLAAHFATYIKYQWALTSGKK